MESFSYTAETIEEVLEGAIGALCACCNGTFPPPPTDCCEDENQCPPAAWPKEVIINFPFGNSGPGGTAVPTPFTVPVTMYPPGSTLPDGSPNGPCNYFEGDMTVTIGDPYGAGPGSYAVLTFQAIALCFCCPFPEPAVGGGPSPVYCYQTDLLTDCSGAYWVITTGVSQVYFDGVTSNFSVLEGGNYVFHDAVGLQTMGYDETVPGPLPNTACVGSTGGSPAIITGIFTPSL